MPRRPTVTTYYRKREGYWTIRWREHGTQREQGGYKTRHEAEDTADKIRKQLRQPIPRIRHTLTVAHLLEHWWDDYVQTPTLQPATRQGYKKDAERILNLWANTPAEHLTPTDIRHGMTLIAERNSNRAANKMRTALSSAYTRALQNELVTTNPCRLVSNFPEHPTPITIPTREQVTLLESTAPNARELALLLIASRAGLRQSEQLGLTWGDYRDNALHISSVADPTTRLTRRTTKTRRSIRRVPLTHRTIEALEAIRPTHTHHTNLIFPSPTDPERPISRTAWRRVHWLPWKRHAAWQAASTELPASFYTPLLDLIWRNLRHHAISRWAAAGVSIVQASRWSGDAVPTLDKHYMHLFSEDEASVLPLID